LINPWKTPAMRLKFEKHAMRRKFKTPSAMGIRNYRGILAQNNGTCRFFLWQKFLSNFAI